MPAIPHILIVKLSSMGDVIHALPVVHQLKAGLGAKVDWVVQGEYAPLAAACPDVARVIEFPRHTWLRQGPAFLRILRAPAYDLVVDLQGLLKSALVARLARSARRIGPSFHREGARWFYSAVAGPRNRNRHAVDEACDVLRHLGLPPAAPEFPLRFPALEFTRGAPRIALVPCSRWPTKNWPIPAWIEAGRLLCAAPGADLFIFGGPADRAAGAAITAGLDGRAQDLCGRLALAELGSWLQTMDLAITVDSGPMHLAAALGVPVLALFGATDPRRTGPYGMGHRVLVADGLDCRPCRSRRCAREDLACLQGILPAQVAEAARAMLAARQAGAP